MTRFFVLLFFVFALQAQGQTVNFVKQIHAKDGSLLRGLHSLEFRLVDKSENAYPKWQQQSRIYLADGLISVNLGDPAQGSSGVFPEELLETHTLEIVENGVVLERINLSSEADEPAQQIPASVQSAKVLVSDIDQASATNNQVLTWVTAEQSWRPRTPQTSGTGGTTGVNTLNAIKGDITIEGISPLLVNTSSGKVSLSLAANAIPQNTGVPVGTIVAFYGNKNSVPDGWLVCDGSSLNPNEHKDLINLLASLGENGTKTPDLRGQFLRGANMDRDAATGDPDWSKRSGTGEKIGSVQADELVKHKHVWPYYWYGQGPNNSMVYPSMINHGQPNNAPKNPEATSAPEFGGSETRPKNIAIHWIIKAKL